MITYRLKIDAQGERERYEDIVFTTGDKRGYRLEFAFYSYGARLDVSGCALTVKARRADGAVIIDSGYVNGQTAYYNVADNMYDVEGDVKLETALTGVDGSLVTVSVITARVRAGFGESGLTSEDNAPVLAKLESGLMTAQGAISTEASARAGADELLQAALNKKADIAFCICTTAEGVADKVAASQTGDFALKAGVAVDVHFINYNTAEDPTLNVDNTGAIAIKKYRADAVNNYMWHMGAIVRLVYDGTYWVMSNGTLASTVYYGLTKLSTSTTSDSEAYAATPRAVKIAYDKGVAALEAAESAQTEIIAEASARQNADDTLQNEIDTLGEAVDAHKTDAEAHPEAFALERTKFNSIYSNALKGSASGNNITVTDSVNGTPVGLTLYGACTETLADKTQPKSPDNPATITGIGESGSVTVTQIKGKNLFDADTLYDRMRAQAAKNGYDPTPVASDNVTFDGRTCVRCNQLGVASGTPFFENGKPNTQYTFTMWLYTNADTDGAIITATYTDGTRGGVPITKHKEWEKLTLTTTAGKTVKRIWLTYGVAVPTFFDKSSMMLNEGATALPYEPYDGEDITVPLASPLYDLSTSNASTSRRDRVSPNGIYRATCTAELDTVDFGCINPSTAYTGCAEFYAWKFDGKANGKNEAIAMRHGCKLMITHFGGYSYHANPNHATDDIWAEVMGGGNGRLRIFARDSFLGIEETDDSAQKVTKLTNWFAAQKTAGTPVKMYYGLNTPYMDTPAGQALLALEAKNGTSYLNSEGADMEVSYNRDVNKAIEELQNAIAALGTV